MLIISNISGLFSISCNAAPALQTDLIANGLSDLLSALSRHALRYSDGRQSPWLSAKDPTRNPVPAAVVQEKLRDLTHNHTTEVISGQRRPTSVT